MDQNIVKALLHKHLSGEIGTDEVASLITDMPVLSMKEAVIDTHRATRTNVPEVIFGLGKTSDQIVSITRGILDSTDNGILLTKLDEAKIDSLKYHFSLEGVVVDEIAKCAFVGGEKEPAVTGKGNVLVICAGTSDLPIAREAYFCARYLGNRTHLLLDVGVAGIHRLFNHLEEIRNASLIIAIAGMEGALASILGGLTKAPIIGVPTSVGYGASFGGIAALLSMLNSCSPGTAVVNIDNGFGAAVVAHKMNHTD